MARQKPSYSAQQIAAIATCLREPQGRARRLLAANERWNAALDHRRNTPQKQSELRRHIARIGFPQRRKLIELIDSDPRPRLLVSYHFGDYIYGLNLLGAGIGDHAAVYYLSQAPGSAAYFANLRRAFGKRAVGPESQLIVGEAGPGALAPLLRRPGVQFITFCDLSEQFGGRAEVDFLHRPAWFPRGPALLSLTNRIPIVPVINWFDGKRGQLVLGHQIEPERAGGEALASAAERISAALVRFFEPFFRTNPEQWRYLGALPLYFIQPGARGANQTQETPHEQTHEASHESSCATVDATARQDLATAHPLHR